MIKANELRIGNKVYFDFHKDSGARQVIDVCVEDLIHLGNEKEANNYNEIPLTEEIFLKCGGTRESLYIQANDFGIRLDGGICVEIEYDSIEIESCICLHQLQNLYFALTNKELEVNL